MEEEVIFCLTFRKITPVRANLHFEFLFALNQLLIVGNRHIFYNQFELRADKLEVDVGLR